MVQWTGRHRPKVEVEVRFLLGVLRKKGTGLADSDPVPFSERYPRGLTERALPCEGGDGGSIPPGDTESRCALGRPAALVKRMRGFDSHRWLCSIPA